MLILCMYFLFILIIYFLSRLQYRDTCSVIKSVTMSTERTSFISLLQQGISIDQHTADQRFDRFLRKLFESQDSVSLWMLYKALRKWDIRIMKNWTWNTDLTWNKAHKAKESYHLQLWDVVIFSDRFLNFFTNLPTHQVSNSPIHQFPNSYTLSDFKSRIIEEDDIWLILNKPSWILMHPGNWSTSQDLPQDQFLTLQDGIDLYYKDQFDTYSTFRPNFGYRLDKYTSGLVIVAKTYPALQHINALIREHKVIKEYQSVVSKQPPKHLDIQLPLKKIVDQRFGRAKMIVCDPHDPYAQDAHTLAQRTSTRTDKHLGQLSLLSVQLKTGRMHQIRAHFAHEWYPVLWDIVYGTPSINRKAKTYYAIHRQLLHARRYSFEDIDWISRSFEAPLPSSMTSLLPF